LGTVSRSSFITSTPNGRIPAYKAGYKNASMRTRDEGEGSATLIRNPTDNPEDRALGERCITSFGYSAGPVMPPLLYNNNYAFAQSKDAVAILVEMVHDVRMIHIGAAHRTDGLRPGSATRLAAMTAIRWWWKLPTFPRPRLSAALGRS
jgi:hypothetical protein